MQMACIPRVAPKICPAMLPVLSLSPLWFTAILIPSLKLLATRAAKTPIASASSAHQPPPFDGSTSESRLIDSSGGIPSLANFNADSSDAIVSWASGILDRSRKTLLHESSIDDPLVSSKMISANAPAAVDAHNGRGKRCFFDSGPFSYRLFRQLRSAPSRHHGAPSGAVDQPRQEEDLQPRRDPSPGLGAGEDGRDR